jgi:uncharacterized protein YgbK (DUF1537 family)
VVAAVTGAFSPASARKCVALRRVPAQVRRTAYPASEAFKEVYARASRASSALMKKVSTKGQALLLMGKSDKSTNQQIDKSANHKSANHKSV